MMPTWRKKCRSRSSLTMIQMEGERIRAWTEHLDSLVASRRGGGILDWISSSRSMLSVILLKSPPVVAKVILRRTGSSWSSSRTLSIR